MDVAEAKELAVRATEAPTLLERQLAASRLLVELSKHLAPWKRCTCCQAVYSQAEWTALPYVGEQDTEDDTGRYRTEYRNCTGTGCGTTLAIEEKVR